MAGSVNRGSRPSKHQTSSGSVARKVLQALEKISVLSLDPTGGRMISPGNSVGVNRFLDGQKDLDRIAQQIVDAKNEA